MAGSPLGAARRFNRSLEPPRPPRARAGLRRRLSLFLGRHPAVTAVEKQQGPG